MAHESVKTGLRGVAAGVLTPFDDGLEIDHDALAENVREIADRGMETFLACANISEYHSLSHEERIAVTETAIDALPSDATVLAGAGGSTKTAIDLATAFEGLGADAIMVMPPDHTFKHERGLLAYYRKLGDAIRIPLVPYLRGFDPSVGFVADLTDLDAVAGVKWAVQDVPKFAEAVDVGADDVVWVDGMAEPHAPALWIEGAEGFTAGVSNFVPEVGLALYDALARGDLERAREIRDVTVPYMNFRGEKGKRNTFPSANSVPAVKAGLGFAGLTGGRVREPLVALSDEDYRRARELYEDIEAFVEEEL